VNVNEYDAPFGSESEENGTGEPVSEAMMWGTLSWFVHETVVPVFTESEPGSNAKFLIAMVFPPPVTAGGVAVTGADGYDVQAATMQARITRRVHAVQNTMREYDGIRS